MEDEVWLLGRRATWAGGRRGNVSCGRGASRGLVAEGLVCIDIEADGETGPARACELRGGSVRLKVERGWVGVERAYLSILYVC